MGGYFNRGASTGGHDDGYFNRDNVTGPEGIGSATGGVGGVGRDDVGYGGQSNEVYADPDNPNVVRAAPQWDNDERTNLDETAGNTSPERIEADEPGIIEGSDSMRTGNSWGKPGNEDASTVETPRGDIAEGEGAGDAAPNRNTSGLTRDELDDVGAWGTMGSIGSAGSPSGNS